MKQEKYAFSLAEALITLLIVCLIILASIPVLTKKKRTLNTTHGSWICTIDENDQHVIYSSTTNAWTPSGQTNKCTFVPPINARNFEVTIVGGGGGGASGYTERTKKIYHSSINQNITEYFKAPADGEYEFIVIGGGQGGNRQNDKDRCKENPGGPGGSGGFNHGFLNLVKGRTYTIVAGAGKAAQPVRPAVVPSMKKLEATIGRGGTGATNLNSNGGRGGSSYVTIYASDRTTDYNASGGSGGSSQWNTTASASSAGILAGQIGETSLVKLLKSNATGGIPGYYNNDGGKSPDGQAMPFKDRNYFGAGGGGGGAKGSSGAASEEIWGKGGKGAPGAVIIEW